MTAVVASAAIYVPGTALAQPSNDDLADLVRRQAAQIERLEGRIQALEEDENRGTAASNTGTASRSGASAQDNRRSVVDSRQQPQSGPGATDVGNASTPMAQMRKDLDALKQNSVQVDWKSGSPKFSSRDGEFTFQPLGRLQFDYATTDGSRFADREIDGSEFRRLRIGFQGQLMEPILYKVEFDFAEERVRLRRGECRRARCLYRHQEGFRPGPGRGLCGQQVRRSQPRRRDVLQVHLVSGA